MTSTARWRLIALLALGASIAVAAVAPHSQLAQQLAYFLILFVLIIPVHELGHALAGALVGYRILAIVVGAGPPIAAFSRFGVNLQINLLPLGGYTAGVPRRPGQSWVRLRHWIFVAGGPAANVAIYFVLKRMFGPALSDAEEHPLLWAATNVNWTVLAINLLPFRTPEGATSDGYGLCTIPFWSKERIEAANLLLQGSILHRARRHEEARAAWRAGLAKADEPRLLAMFKNNIAFASVVIGREEDLPEADQLSEQALALLPDNGAIAGTRAAVLIRRGRAADGLAMLASGETGVFDAKGRAYNWALAASALAALGRHDEALRKLAEARQADPTCDLIARAEADVAAGPIALAPPATVPVDGRPGTPDPVAGAAALRVWRRDARIAAFAASFALAQAGVNPFAYIILIVVALAPEIGGVIAMAAYGLSASLLYATGLLRNEFFVSPASPLKVALIALAVGAAAIWLIVRHRRLGAVPPSKAPTVLGWVLASLAFLSAAPALISLSLDRSHLGVHSGARILLGEAPVLIALAALLASRRRRGVRRLALAPVVLAVCALVAGSDFYLNRVALADVPVHGAPVTWSDPEPAKIVRSAHFSGAGFWPTVSPGGRAFFLTSKASRPPAVGAGVILRVGDFNGHLVEVAGTAGAFIDDDRLLVFRPRTNLKETDQLVEVRPFRGPEPAWIKEFDGAEGTVAAIRFHQGTGTVFVQSGDNGHPPVVFRTTLDPATPLTAHPLVHRDDDEVLAATLPLEGWGSLLVGRRTGAARELVWRSPVEEHRLGARWSMPECADTPAGGEIIWCFTQRAPILYRLDARTARLTHVPGEIYGAWQQTLLAPSVMAIFRGDEIAVIDLESRRGARLTVPVRSQYPSLANGALATLERPDDSSPEGTLVVYQNPFE